MAEDMTYEPVQTVARLAARVQELEHQLAQADSNTVALAARNAELRARLDAVPVPALIRDYTGWGNRDTTIAIDAWMQTLQEQERQRAKAQRAVQP